MIIEYTVFNISEKDGTEIRYQADKWEDTPTGQSISVMNILKAAQRDHGKCVSKVTQRSRLGTPQVVGWIFSREEANTRVETRVRFLEGCPHCGGTGKTAVVVG